MDARAALIWCASALSAAFILQNPFVNVLLVLSAACLAARADDSLPFRALLSVGLIGVVVRTIMFMLTGHEGQTILFELPRWSLPLGLVIGGRVTAEVLVTSATEGVKLLTVLSCLGALISVVPTIELLRLLPARLRDAGLVLNIAIAFAPQVVRSARDIRDARWSRSRRRNRFASLASLLVPVIATATERSITLAEAMDSRGYGRRATQRPSRLRISRWGRKDRFVVVCSLVAVSGAVLTTLMLDAPGPATQMLYPAPVAALAIAASFAIPSLMEDIG